MDLGALVLGPVALVALVNRFTDFLRLLTHLRTEGPAIRAQVAAWSAGVAAVFLYSASDFGHITLADSVPALDDLGSASKVIMGLALASGAGVLYKLTTAVDNTDSAKVPPMGGTTG